MNSSSYNQANVMQQDIQNLQDKRLLDWDDEEDTNFNQKNVDS